MFVTFGILPVAACAIADNGSWDPPRKSVREWGRTKNSLDASDMQEAAPYGTLVLPQRAVLASLTVNNQSNRVHRVTD